MSEPVLPIHFVAKDVFNDANVEQRLSSWFDLLRLECEKLNLVSRETLNTQGDERMVSGLERLTVESILPLQVIEQEQFDSYLDIGSGGGFPSIPILLTKQIKRVTLVERTQKKATALQRMMTKLHNNFLVLPINLDDLKLPPVTFDLISLRLVKLDSKIIRHIKTFLRPGGVFIYYYTPDTHLDLSSFEVSNYVFNDDSGHKPLQCTLLRKKMR